MALYIKWNSWKLGFATVLSFMLTADTALLVFANTLGEKNDNLSCWLEKTTTKKKVRDCGEETTGKNIVTFFLKTLLVSPRSELASDIVLALSVMRPINYEKAAMQMDLINCLLSPPWLLYLQGEVFISVILKQVRKLFCQSARNDSDRVEPSRGKKKRKKSLRSTRVNFPHWWRWRHGDNWRDRGSD